MKTFHRVVVVFAVLLCASSLGDGSLDKSACTFNGFKLYGRIQVVDVFPDVKVQKVTVFADLKVQKVDVFPDACGKWQLVDVFPDTKVQFVDVFPDVKVQYVDVFPGVD